MMLVLIFILGSVIGSFFNVVLYRLWRQEEVVFKPSHCPLCSHGLAWYDLVPLVSFVFLRGRCRYCGKRISYVYPLVEAVTAVTLTLFFVFNPAPLSWQTGFGVLMLLGFLLLSLFDARYLILPDKITLPLSVLALGYAAFFEPQDIFLRLAIGFLLAGFFAILYVVSGGRWMGLGDAKLALLIGFVFGYPAGLLVTVFAVWAAAAVGLALISLGRATMKTALPFGTFLSLLSVIFIIFRDEIISLNRFFF